MPLTAVKKLYKIFKSLIFGNDPRICPSFVKGFNITPNISKI